MPNLASAFVWVAVSGFRERFNIFPGIEISVEIATVAASVEA
jgi:hypothetical protein